MVEESKSDYYTEPSSVVEQQFGTTPDMIYPHLEISMAKSEEDENEFTVSDPVKGSHVMYTVKGRDDDGPFEGQRRYNDFWNV